ncbi:MAG: hypothetical protein HYX65_07175 [Gemmatimonadetes bacterium]|nr:hypothetical protein [Gemmatimonadota bacterium]
MSDLSRLEALEDRLAKLTLQLADARREIAQIRAGVGGVAAAPPLPSPAGPASASFASTAAASAPPGTPPGSPSGPPSPGPEASSPTPPRGADAPHAEPRHPPQPEPGFRPPPRAPALDLEKLVGRYGVLALAVLMIVMGAGALVSWALARGLIGPWVRVGLGLILAAILAAAGYLIRRKSNRWFGDALLALSLAVVHVVAWGMGPALRLVPAAAALVVADLASIALCWFALHEDIEELFSFGLFGALVAPFVTSTGEARHVALAAYGIAVIAGGLRTASQRPWQSVGALLSLGTLWYSAALSGGAGQGTALERTLVSSFAGAVTVFALALERPPLRPLLAAVAVTAMTLGLAAAQAWNDGNAWNVLYHAPELMPLAGIAAGLSMFASSQLPKPPNVAAWGWLALVLPLLALLSMPLFEERGVGATQLPGDLVNGAIALLWAAGYWFMSRRETAEQRAALQVAAGLASAMAVALATRHGEGLMVPALAAHAVAFGALARRGSDPRLLAASAVSLLVGFSVGMMNLLDRPFYRSTPFLTIPSLECASVVLGAWLAARLGAPDALPLLGAPRTREQVAKGTALLLAFAWGRAELGQMVSHDVATFTIVIYYAIVGILLIRRGRRIAAPMLRHAGLALAVWAALTALGRAAGVDDILFRVGSYLGVGLFLLGVAWWYRVDSAPAGG